MDTKHPINVLVLEKYLLGELGEDENRKLEDRLERDPAVKKALEDMERSNREFFSRFPPERVVPDILARCAGKTIPSRENIPPRPRRARKRMFYLAPAAAAAAALVLLLVLDPRPGGKSGFVGIDTTPDTTIIKGLSAVDLNKTQLFVFRRRGEQAELMKDGQSAAEGDLLQLAYVSGAEPYGLILSLDGRGEVTRHFPLAPGRPSRLEIKAKVLLPMAVELDDAPHFERFFFVTSLRPIDEDEVLRLASELASDPRRAGRDALALPEGLNQSSLIIYKGNGQ